MKKTILYLVTQSELGGAQMYVFDLASKLKNDYQVILAFGEQGEKGKLAEMAKKENIKYFVIENLKREISTKNDINALLEIKNLIKKIKPDIVHLNSSKISVLGSIAAKLEKVPQIIYTVHGWVFNEKLNKKIIKKYKRIEKFTAFFKNDIICVSNFDYKAAIKEKICNKKKLTVIHNGIATPNYLDKKTAQIKLLNQLKNNNINTNIDDSTILIGTIGNLYKNKGYHYLINAIKLIINQQKNVKLIIIGDGEEKDELLTEIRQLNLQKNIFITGQIENAATLLKAFDLYVCSSLKEGLSYTIIEAMLAKLPIIATQVGGNGELIGKDREGLLIPSQDIQKIASAILTLMENKNLAQQLAQNAQTKAKQEFTLLKMVEETKKIYDKSSTK